MDRVQTLYGTVLLKNRDLEKLPPIILIVVIFIKYGC